MKYVICFTDKGEHIAKKISEISDAQVTVCRAGNGNVHEWTAEHFQKGNVLIYVGAAGIAVRAIGPRLVGKDRDPAVLVVDENGNYVIPILSGHLGGANREAELLAEKLGGTAIITTATDGNRRFAIDSWAKENGLAIRSEEISKIKLVSSKILSGKNLVCHSDYEIKGKVSWGITLMKDTSDCDFAVSVRSDIPAQIHCIPRILTLGIGCRKGADRSLIEELFAEICEELKIFPEAITAVCTIDIKKEEEGILEFCSGHEFSLYTATAEQLMELEGEFTASAFVMDTVGCDNVCERSAVWGTLMISDTPGRLILKKRAKNGVTMAIAEAEFHPGWESETWD